jgi:hypothetical protein
MAAGPPQSGAAAGTLPSGAWWQTAAAQHSTAYTRHAMLWACDSPINISISPFYTNNAQHKHFSCMSIGNITLQSNRSQNAYASHLLQALFEEAPKTYQYNRLSSFLRT